LADLDFLAAGRVIVKEEGLSALWAGLGPTAWGYLFEGAVKFGVYEISKPVMTSFLCRLASSTSINLFRSQLFSFALCGILAGFAASFMLSPMEAIRIRMVAEPDFAPKGWIQGGMKIMKNEGVQGLSKGIKPMILKQVPYTVTKNVSFDLITRFLYSTITAAGASISTAVSVTVPLFAAVAASVLSTISSQPGDMVLSLVNAHKGNQTVRDFVNGILRSERGVRGFFVGFKTRLLLSGVTVTIQLLVYDMVKRLCGIAATGSI
jgi:solute carrier family 25 (mitochondrial phosphate transporter), member 3